MRGTSSCNPVEEENWSKRLCLVSILAVLAVAILHAGPPFPAITTGSGSMMWTTPSPTAQPPAPPAGPPTFPEIDYIWLPDSPTDITRAQQMLEECDTWVPGGRSTVRMVQAVNPLLWPGGRYDEVERWCAMLPTDPKYFGNVDPGPKWWRKPNSQIRYAAVDGAGQTLSPQFIHHVGCTLSHFVAWMDARARGVQSMIISESDGLPSRFGYYSGYVGDFRHLMPELLSRLPLDWDIVLLDKCKAGSKGGPVLDINSPPTLKNKYHVYKWIGQGMAGAALYMVSGRFLQSLPEILQVRGLDMVDAWLGLICANLLQCFSVCATGAPWYG